MGEKGSALAFDEAEWIITCQKLPHMDELITRHSAIMDQYDPENGWASLSMSGELGFLLNLERIQDSYISKHDS